MLISRSISCLISIAGSYPAPAVPSAVFRPVRPELTIFVPGVRHVPGNSSNGEQKPRIPCIPLPGLPSLLRRFLSNDIPACLSFRPSSALRQPSHSLLCFSWHALNTNENPAHSGMSFSGNRLNEWTLATEYRISGVIAAFCSTPSKECHFLFIPARRY